MSELKFIFEINGDSYIQELNESKEITNEHFADFSTIFGFLETICKHPECTTISKMWEIIESEQSKREVNIMKRFEQMQTLIDYLGEKEALEALTRAMSDDEFDENFNYICQMYEINADADADA